MALGPPVLIGRADTSLVNPSCLSPPFDSPERFQSSSGCALPMFLVLAGQAVSTELKSTATEEEYDHGYT